MALLVYQAGAFWWSDTSTASLSVTVFERNFINSVQNDKVFHQRKAEILPEGGDPIAQLRSMTTFALARYQKLIGIWAPF